MLGRPIDIVDHGILNKRKIIERLFEERAQKIPIVRVVVSILVFLGCLLLVHFFSRETHPIAKIACALGFFVPLFLAMASLAWLEYYTEVGVGLLVSFFLMALISIGATVFYYLRAPHSPQSPALAHFIHSN